MALSLAALEQTRVLVPSPIGMFQARCTRSSLASTAARWGLAQDWKEGDLSPARARGGLRLRAPAAGHLPFSELLVLRFLSLHGHALHHGHRRPNKGNTRETNF